MPIFTMNRTKYATWWSYTKIAMAIQYLSISTITFILCRFVYSFHSVFSPVVHHQANEWKSKEKRADITAKQYFLGISLLTFMRIHQPLRHKKLWLSEVSHEHCFFFDFRSKMPYSIVFMYIENCKTFAIWNIYIKLPLFYLEFQKTHRMHL